MPTWKLTLEYDGTRYRGWQSQKNTERTVAGVLLRAARELLGEDASLGGSGRTDAGVHALAQVAHLKAKKSMPPVRLRREAISIRAGATSTGAASIATTS